jgi:hypothetical protein
MVIRTLMTIDKTVVMQRARRGVIAFDLLVFVMRIACEERFDSTSMRTWIFVGRRRRRLIAAATVT